MKILKFCRKRRVHRRAKMCGFPLEIQQFRNLDEIMGSVDAAKIEYNLENMKDSENQWSTRKKKQFQKPYKTWRFWTKIDDDAPTQKKTVSKSLWNLSFLNDFDDNKAQEEVTHCEILSMAAATARFWGSKDKEPNDTLSNFQLGCSHSTILRSKRWRKNRDFERHCSFAKRYRLHRWRENRSTLMDK